MALSANLLPTPDTLDGTCFTAERPTHNMVANRVCSAGENCVHSRGGKQDPVIPRRGEDLFMQSE
jgi:hypothetical protein